MEGQEAPDFAAPGVKESMIADRGYSIFVFTGISLLVHLGLVAATRGFHPAAPPLDMSEIDVGIVPERPDSSAPSKAVLKPNAPKLLRQSLHSIRSGIPDPFAATSLNSRSGTIRPIVANETPHKMPRVRQEASLEGEPKPGGPPAFGASGFGSGSGGSGGAPRTRRMSATAMQTPAPQMNFLPMRRPGYSNGIRIGQGDADGQSSAPQGRQETPPLSENGPTASVGMEAGASGPLLTDDTAETARRQQSFVPARIDERFKPFIGYPDAARLQRQQGVVILRVELSALGRLNTLEVESSSGFPLLDEAAIAAVRKYSFLPARNLDGPLASWLTLPFRFNLN